MPISVGGLLKWCSLIWCKPYKFQPEDLTEFSKVLHALWCINRFQKLTLTSRAFDYYILRWLKPIITYLLFTRTVLKLCCQCQRRPTTQCTFPCWRVATFPQTVWAKWSCRTRSTCGTYGRSSKKVASGACSSSTCTCCSPRRSKIHTEKPNIFTRLSLWWVEFKYYLT